MNLVDIELFLNSLRNNRPWIKIENYWDQSSDEEFNRLVRHLSDTETLERRLIRSILSDLKPSSLLDAACGPATELKGYINNSLNFEYFGLDSSRRMLQVAKNLFPDHNFILGSVEQLPFEDLRFEVVLLRHVLEHLPGYQKALEEAARVSKKAMIADLFHTLLPFGPDIFIKHKRGYYENWYVRSRFEKSIKAASFNSFRLFRTLGSSGQTAEVYLATK